MKKSSVVISIALGGLVLVTGFQNCSPKTSFSKAELPSVSVGIQGEESSAPPVNVICDPLSGGSQCALEEKSGLIGNIYYLNSAQSTQFNGDLNNAKLADYYNLGAKVETPLLMSQFNITNRSFLSGFIIGQDSAGANILAKDSAGNDLVEWFAIKVSGHIMVDAADEGLYQFAVNSDDGSKLKVDGATIIDNDGVHAVVRKESSSLISLVRNAKKSIEIQYFQGPRQMIALEVFFRKCEVQSSESSCLQFGAWKSLPASSLSHE
jgi:hypothetical protein